MERQTAEKIIYLQNGRCVNCGSCYAVHIHHRIFRSEGDNVLKSHLQKFKQSWGIDDIQNLVLLCLDCHEGKNGVHNGNEKLRQFLRNTFTDPKTGFNCLLRKCR